jgi:hypothetical protein
LKAWRLEIIEELLTAKPDDGAAGGECGDTPEAPDFAQPIECRWGMGYVGRHYYPAQGWPVGARFWRYAGEGDAAWRPIPPHELPKTRWPSQESYERARGVGECRQ